ncbi:hypothetical protein BCEP4_500066 [Burkholderia cepacia]|nr:hypothetical protein BCEP4_500066 [Burkholderia cepacia]
MQYAGLAAFWWFHMTMSARIVNDSSARVRRLQAGRKRAANGRGAAGRPISSLVRRIAWTSRQSRPASIPS